MTPKQALEALVQGNRRYAEGRAEHPGCGADRRRDTLAHGQHPLAAVLGCSDSRVPPELLFDQGVGDLFVVRTAGHVLDEAGLASIEYAVDHLHVPLLVVLGHSRCGAITAAVQGGEAHGHLAGLLGHLAPVVRQARAEAPGADADAVLARAIELQVSQASRQLLEQCAPVRRAVEAGACRLVGANYDLSSGLVTWPAAG